MFYCCFAAHLPEGRGRAAGKGAGGEAEERAAAGRAAGPVGPEDIHQVPEGPGAQPGAGHATGGRDVGGREQNGRRHVLGHGRRRVGRRRSSQGVATGAQAAVRGPAGVVLDHGAQARGGGGTEKGLKVGQSAGRRRGRDRRSGGRVGGHGHEPAGPRRGQGPRLAGTRRERAQGVSEAAKGAHDRGPVRCRRWRSAAGDDRRDGRAAASGPDRRTGTGRGTAAHAAAGLAAKTRGGRALAAAAAVRVHAAAAAARSGRAGQDRGPEGRLQDGRAVHQPAADGHRGHDGADRGQAGRAVCRVGRAVAAAAAAAAAATAPPSPSPSPAAPACDVTGADGHAAAGRRGPRVPDQEHGRPDLADDAQTAAHGPAAAQQVAHAVLVVRAAAHAAVQPQGHVAAPVPPVGIAQKTLPPAAKRLSVTYYFNNN